MATTNRWIPAESANAKTMVGFNGDPFEELSSWLLRLQRNVLDSDQEELSVRLEKFLCQERKEQAMGNEEITKRDKGTLRTPTTSSCSMKVKVLCPHCRREEAKENIWLSEINKIESENSESRRTRRRARIRKKNTESLDPERRIRRRASGRGIEQVASGKEHTDRRRMTIWTDYLIYCMSVYTISLAIVYVVII